MNLFVLFGLIVATLATMIYLTLGYINKRTPQLNDTVVIFLGIGGIVSGVRIMGAVFTGHFSNIALLDNKDSIWALVPDDAIQIALGGVALAWVSAQTVIGSFQSVLVRKTGAHSPESTKLQEGQTIEVSGAPKDSENLVENS